MRLAQSPRELSSSVPHIRCAEFAQLWLNSIMSNASQQGEALGSRLGATLPGMQRIFRGAIHMEPSVGIVRHPITGKEWYTPQLTACTRPEQHVGVL